MKIYISLFLIFCLTACQSQTSYDIQIYDQVAYTLTKPFINIELQEKQIVHEKIISTHALNFDATKKAKILAEKLDFSFRYPQKTKSIFAKDYVDNGAKLTLHAYGFVLEHGTQIITATLLGQLNWDAIEGQEYLLSVTVRNEAMSYIHQSKKTTTELPARQYILLLPSLELPLLSPKILYIRDYIKHTSSTTSQLFLNHKEAQNSFFQEQLATDFKQGQEKILMAPHETDRHEKQTTDKEKSIVETKLSE